MAQGDFFELGVAYPIKNHKFRNPTVISVSLTQSDSDTSITVNEISTTFLVKVQKGDVLNLVNSSGQSENAIVSAVSKDGQNTQIDLESSLTYSYASGDNVTVFGTRLAGGWDLDSTTTPINSFDINTIGASDNYAQVLRSSGVSRGIIQTLDSNELLDFTSYRFGCEIKSDIDIVGGGIARIEVRLNDGQGSQNHIVTGIDITSFTEFKDIPTFLRKIQSSGASITLYFNKANSGTTIYAVFDDVFLEHARGTTYIGRVKSTNQAGTGNVWTIVFYDNISSDFSVDDALTINDGTNYAQMIVLTVGTTSITAIFVSGTNNTTVIASDSEIQKSNDGYLAFTEYADEGSISIKKITGERSVILGDNSGSVFNPKGGDKSEKWLFGCTFTTFPQALWDKLMVLLRWQSRGNFISFHPNIDDLPSVMVGKLTIDELNKGTRASAFLSYRDISFTFEELKL